MLIKLKALLTKLALKALAKLDPSYTRPVLIQTTPHQALGHIVAAIDKQFGSAWDKPTVPTDDIETLMFRAGAKGYRTQLLKEIHASSPASLL